MTHSTTTPSTVTQLPPDPDGQNDNRATWADQAVRAFRYTTGTDREDALSDLLCDLMHLCDRDAKLGDFESQLRRARGHYAAETALLVTESAPCQAFAVKRRPA